jgi:hypothetical protein
MLGAGEERTDHPLTRLWNMFVYAFGQKRVISKPFGFNHFVIYTTKSVPPLLERRCHGSGRASQPARALAAG